MDRQIQAALKLSVLETVIWISSRSDKLVDRGLSSFEEAETVFSHLVRQGARFTFSFAQARDVEFPLALKGGLVGVATEAHLLETPHGFLVAPKNRNQVEIPGPRLGLGIWAVRDGAKAVLTPRIEGTSGDEKRSTDTPNVTPWTGQHTPVLHWRAEKSDALPDGERFVDVEFKREDVLARWPPPPEQEARRRAAESPPTILWGFGKKLPAWETHGSSIPLGVAIDFLAFGHPEESAGVISIGADAPQAEHQITRLICAIHAEQAIFAAARDGKVELHGRAAGGSGATTGAMSAIAAAEFATKRRLATNRRSDIARDETRPSYFPAPADWVDVVVEKLRFLKWIRSVKDPVMKRATANIVEECTVWLVRSRRAGRPAGPKSYYWELAKEQFRDLGRSQFRDAWRTAAAREWSDGWGVPGRPRKETLASD